MVLRVAGTSEGSMAESPMEETQKVVDTSKVERIAGETGKPRQRGNIELRGLDRRQKDIRDTFPKWDEAIVGRRNKKDRRETQRRKGPVEQRGNSPMTHYRATDLNYIRTVTEREIHEDQPEGAGNVTAIGSRRDTSPPELPPIVRRPEGTAVARLNAERPEREAGSYATGGRRPAAPIGTRVKGDNFKPVQHSLFSLAGSVFKAFWVGTKAVFGVVRPKKQEEQAE
jgi:hypothetical protein